MSTMTIGALNLVAMDADDKRAARKRVAEENSIITRQNNQLLVINQQRSQNTPPLDPIANAPLLDIATAGALKASYETCLIKDILARHAQLIVTATNEAAASIAEFESLKPVFAEAASNKWAAMVAAATAASV